MHGRRSIREPPLHARSRGLPRARARRPRADARLHQPRQSRPDRQRVALPSDDGARQRHDLRHPDVSRRSRSRTGSRCGACAHEFELDREPLLRGFKAEGKGTHLLLGHGSDREHMPPGKEAIAPFTGAEIAASGVAHAMLGHFHWHACKASATRIRVRSKPHHPGQGGRHTASLVTLEDGRVGLEFIDVNRTRYADADVDLSEFGDRAALADGVASTPARAGQRRRRNRLLPRSSRRQCAPDARCRRGGARAGAGRRLSRRAYRGGVHGDRRGGSGTRRLHGPRRIRARAAAARGRRRPSPSVRTSSGRCATVCRHSPARGSRRDPRRGAHRGLRPSRQPTLLLRRGAHGVLRTAGIRQDDAGGLHRAPALRLPWSSVFGRVRQAPPVEEPGHLRGDARVQARRWTRVRDAPRLQHERRQDDHLRAPGHASGPGAHGDAQSLSRFALLRALARGVRSGRAHARG